MNLKAEPWLKKFGELAAKYKYVLVVIAVGVVILLIPSGKEKSEQIADVVTPDAQYETYSLEEQERRLSELLAQVNGAGRVRVMLTLRSGAESVYLSESRESSGVSEDESGYSEDVDTERDAVVLSDGSGGQKAVVSKTLYPQYQGALIVCDGADNSVVRLKIVEAVSSLLGLGSDKIVVARMKN